MAQILVIVRDSNSNVVPQPTISWPGGSLRGGADGTATVVLDNSYVGQILSITASAPGCTPASQNLKVTQYTSTVAFALKAALSVTAKSITITDGTLPVPNAEIYDPSAFNGGSLADATGKVSIPVAAGTNQIQIKAQGYQPYSGTFQGSGAPDHIVLKASDPSASNQILKFSSSPPGAIFGINTETGTLGADGTGVTVNPYPPGSYTVSLSYNGQQTSTSITVGSGPSVYALNPVPVSDDGSSASLQTISTADGSPAAPTSSQPGTFPTSNLAASQTSNGTLLAGEDVPDYEFVNPTAGFGRYFTATQARMYIGNLFIEELAGCQFVLQGNQVPIYGYASEAFDAIGNGKYLVQGQLMVHFISEGYLYTVLNEYKKNQGISTDPTVQAFQNLLRTEQELQSSNTSDPSIRARIAQLQQQRMQLLANNPGLASAYKRTSLPGATTAASPNALYRKVPFDIVLELEGGGRTVTRRISNCVLTSNEQIYGDNDSPLIDSYGFIGRSLR